MTFRMRQRVAVRCADCNVHGPDFIGGGLASFAETEIADQLFRYSLDTVVKSF